MRRYGWLAALLAALLALTGCAGGEDGGAEASGYAEFESQTWRITCSGGEDSPAGRAAADFGQRIFRETNGAVRVECSFSDQLTGGDAAAGLQALAEGETDLALYSGEVCSRMDPRFQVVSLPFLFDSAQEADKALDGEGGAALGEILAEYGLRCIGIGAEGFRLPTNSVRPIACVEDLKGLRIWVGDSEIQRRVHALWGAEVADTLWAGVYTALQTGTCEGQETQLSVADAASIQTVQRYVTDWTGVYDCLYFCMNAQRYGGLSPALQEIVDRCGRETAAYQREISRERDGEILNSWKRAGVTVTELSEEAAREFRSSAESCYREFTPLLTEELMAVFTGE